MKNKVLNLIKLLVVLLLFFQAGSLFVNLFNKVGIDLSLFDYKDSAYLDALVGIFLFIIIFLIYNKALFKDWNKFKEKLNENIKKVFAIFGILLGAKLIVGVFTSILAVVFNIDYLQSENQRILELLIESAPAMMMLSSVIIAPFIEEVIFRLGFKKVIKNKVLFILISGLIFGLMHIIPSSLSLFVLMLQSIIYISLGVVLAYIYEKEKNIYLVIIPHALNNLLGILAALILL